MDELGVVSRKADFRHLKNDFSISPENLAASFCMSLLLPRQPVPLEELRDFLESDRLSHSQLEEIARRLFESVSFQMAPGEIPEKDTWEGTCLAAAMMAKNFAIQERHQLDAEFFERRNNAEPGE